MSDLVLVSAAPHPFSTDHAILTMQAGQTLAQIIERAGVAAYADVRVFIEREGQVWGPIPAAQWAHIRPRAGSQVAIRAVPHGGGGDDNKTIRLVLTIVVILVAIVLTVAFPYLAPLWGLLAAIDIAAINYVFYSTPELRAPTLTLPHADLLAPSNTYDIQGSRNRANLYGPIPVIYGQHRVFPAFGALPYTEVLGNDQYLRQLFVIGYGPLQITDLRIGETPIDSFTGVEYEVRQGYDADAPVTLYATDVNETPLSLLITNAGGPQSRVTGQECDEISVDISFLQGLAEINDFGFQIPYAIQMEIEYRKVGDAGWTNAFGGGIQISDSRLSQVRRGFRWVVPTRALYEVRITRDTADNADLMIHDQSTWTSLRAIQQSPPITKVGLAQVALRIKATDQLQGIVDQFNCLAQAILPDWDEGSGTWITRATSSPAAAYRAALQGKGNARPVADARIALSSLQQWAVDAAAKGFTFNEVVDFRHTVFEQLRDIATAGRAAFTMIDGKFGVVQDKAQSTPVQHFTPRNSADFHGRKAFIDFPHAFKVRFVNPDKKWQQDEVLVYDDGYNAGNATRFEVLDTLGITNSDQAWKLGRYHLAALRLRPEMYEFTTDFENIVCTRGDLIRLSHDVLLVGLGASRVKSVQTNGGNCTGITVDDLCPMAVGKTYAVRMRYSDGTSVTKTVVTNAGEQTVLVFQTPFVAPMPAVGDLILFGESGLESMEVIVKEIAHDRDLTARITCLPYSPAIYSADTGPIPPFDSMITLPPIIARTSPLPVIDAVVSDESVLIRDLDGALRCQIVLSVHYQPVSAVEADWVDVQYRRTDTPDSEYTSLPQQPPGTSLIFITQVQEGIAYDIRLRTGSTTGVASDWATALNHTVVGKTSAPPDVTDIAVVHAAEGDRLTWQYPVFPRDFAGFLVRIESGVGERWETALPLFGNFITPTVFVLPLLYGTWTFYVKAYDVSRNESENAASYTFDFGDPRVQNIVERFDQEPTWAGTKTGCEVSGDDLVALSASAFWTVNGALFWTADGNTFWTGGFADMLYEFSATTSADAEGCRGMFEWMVQGEGWALEYQKDGDAGWIGWPGQLSPVKGSQTYNFRASLSGGSTQGIISQLDFIIDAPEQSDTFSNVAIAVTTGTRLTLPRTYRGITTVQATAIEDGGTGISARVVDRDAANGPLIKVLDAAGAVVAGHVDATIVGY